MTPQRIQLSRKKGFRLPPNTVVVSRPSKWGNPYKLGGFVPGIGMLKTMADVVKAYREFVTDKLNEDEMFRVKMDIELRGKNLACWCKPGEPCHADVLLEIANQS